VLAQPSTNRADFFGTTRPTYSSPTGNGRVDEKVRTIEPMMETAEPNGLLSIRRTCRQINFSLIRGQIFYYCRAAHQAPWPMVVATRIPGSLTIAALPLYKHTRITDGMHDISHSVQLLNLYQYIELHQQMHLGNQHIKGPFGTAPTPDSKRGSGGAMPNGYFF
jgi:hypothetical protein